jgi:proline iminopeptidase
MLVDGEYVLPAGGIGHWVRVAGSVHGGVPLVHVHGGPGGNARPVEVSVGDAVARLCTVVFYDQRGCGRSQHSAENYRIDRLVADLDELRAGLGIERITPWGVSFGCLVAAEYAVTHPDRVDRLILHAPPIAGPLHPGLWAMRPSTLDAVADAATRARLRAALADATDPVQRAWTTAGILDADPEAAARFLYYDPTAALTRKAARNLDDSSARPAADLSVNLEMARALVGTERETLADDLARTDVQTLVLVGLWDRHVGVDLARSLVERLPRAALEVFAHSAHLPDEEEPDAYVAAIRDFLRS